MEVNARTMVGFADHLSFYLQGLVRGTKPYYILFGPFGKPVSRLSI